MKTFNTLIAFFVAMALFSPLAFADHHAAGQAGAGYGAGTPPEPQQVSVSPAEMKEFQKVQQRVIDIQNDYQAKMQGEENPEAANQLVQKANERMVKIVEESSLTVDRYNQIAMALPHSPELQRKLNEVRE